MKGILFLLIPFLFTISSSNELKNLATEEVKKGNRDKALSYLVEIIKLKTNPEPEIFLDLAHLYFHIGKKDSATYYYSKVVSSQDAELASVAENQLAVIAFAAGKRESAENHLRRALFLNHLNHQAAYNYELLKRTEKSKKQNKTPGQKKGNNNRSPEMENNRSNSSPDKNAGSEEGYLLRSAKQEFSKAELEKILETYKKRNSKYLQQEEWKKLNSVK